LPFNVELFGKNFMFFFLSTTSQNSYELYSGLIVDKLSMVFILTKFESYEMESSAPLYYIIKLLEYIVIHF
jgi:hypothetical protein